MKAKISIILLAVVALALLAVAPAAADLQEVPNGGVVFVGEDNLEFANGSATIFEWYAPGDEAGKVTPGYSYPVTTGKNNSIDKTTFQTRTGNWYAKGNYTDPAIIVRMPSIDVKVFTTGTTDDMTNGRVVKTDTYLTFRLDSNLYQAYDRLAGETTTDIKISVTDDQGTTYIALFNGTNDTQLKELQPDKAQFYLDGSNAESSWDLGSSQYKAGVYTFSAQVNLNNIKDNLGAINGVTVSETKTLDIGKDDVKIEASKDTVVRNNDFAVTITGRPNTEYVLWVKGTSSITSETVPYIKANQNGVKSDRSAAAGAYVFDGSTQVSNDVSGTTAPAGGSYYAMIGLSSSGTRTVGFGTDQTTKDQTYTIRTDLYQTGTFSATYDDVKIKVEKGDVTVTASGDSSYYIGEEIVISGTNTDSDDTWLFITGPNLAADGAPVAQEGYAVVTGTATYPTGSIENKTGGFVSTWKSQNVEIDDTWEYKWNTAGVNLDAGTYTVYAVTTPTSRKNLGGKSAIYATASIVIRQPFVTATTSSPTVAKGDDLYITGNAEGDPSPGVAIWILGTNFNDLQTETVEDNGAFEYKFSNTDSLAPGQYFVVVQHPMTNNKFDIYTNDNLAGHAGQTVVVRPVLDPTTPVFILEGPGSLQGSNAATALVNAMDSPDIDDTYYKLTFMVEEPWIMIDAVGDRYVGETFKITGTTNLAVGDSLIIDVSSSSFKPTEKTQGSAFSADSGTVLVTAGDKDGVNVWEKEVDASSFSPDEYIVKVDAVEATQTATQNFNVLKAKPTTEPTVTPVTTPVETTATPVAPTEATPEEAAPGFGVLLSLVGLGAVAALIARKD